MPHTPASTSHTGYDSAYQPRLHRFAVFTAGSTLLLICAGGLVTSTDSGLAVPDWPLSFGMVFPPMVGGVLIEHGHRMIASFVGMLMVVLCAWLLWRGPNRRIKILGAVALGSVCLQGVLGGLNVLWLQPKAVLLAHACLAQAFFCMVVSIALFTSPEWAEPAPREPEARDALAHHLAILCVGLVFFQLLLGASVRHYHAGTAIPDFPLMLGRVIPPLEDPKVIVHFAHRCGALVVALLVLGTCGLVLRRHGALPHLANLALVLMTLVTIQIALGAVTVLTETAVIPTTMHVATGALILAGCLTLALRLTRFVPRPQPATIRALASSQVAS